ncbi:MAG: DUF2075 domain-containing protein [Rhodospirillales bacterium]|nr:DUF2075 domain-containing protein [Rhodospirillales bacterium]
MHHLRRMQVSTFLASDSTALLHRLAHDDMQRFRRNEAQQLRAWSVSLACLREALADWPEAAGWDLLLEFNLRRLGRRIDAVLVTPRGIVVLEFKVGADHFAMADRRQVEDYALDLQDFHAMSRQHPIVPVLIATDATPRPTAWPLLISGAASVLDASRLSLPSLLRELWRRLPAPGVLLDVAAWESAPYRPVPGIVDAACTLYAQHGVADIAAARADSRNLSTTTDAILQAVEAAQATGAHRILFITGIPGAGKTLCGLNATFGSGRNAGAIFLTGNPTLVHVLREALARDAAQADPRGMRAARQRTKVAIQALPAFRDSHIHNGHRPPEHVVVIDEAQRSWSASHAIRKGRDREVALTDSEPGLLLDIMARHADWAVLVCLVGGGQEIHDGEGGLAEWGAALASRPHWQVLAAPTVTDTPDPRQRLPHLPGLTRHEALHLDVPMRSVRNAAVSEWVDAVLLGNWARARDIAERNGGIPMRLTRDLAAMRSSLRAQARGLRRSGLIGSSGAKRLRADGLGVELAHMNPDAVAHWFLNFWPDVRASDALETMATEFSCQGLELDHVGLCWGGDLIRVPGVTEWRARRFIGSAWQTARGQENIANRINTYRVLLTRARYGTVIWVPRGDEGDSTRDPAALDGVADFLLRCGTVPLD